MTNHYKILKFIDCDNLISKCIMHCKKMHYDADLDYINMFKDISLYGDIETPYFMAKHIFKILNNTENNSSRTLKEYYIQETHYIKAKIFDKNTAVNMLTKQGVMKAMYMSKLPTALYFQTYMHDILDNLWKTNNDITVSEIKAIEDKLKKFEIINIKNIANIKDNSLKELKILKRKYMKQYTLYIIDYNYVNDIIKKSSISYDSNIVNIYNYKNIGCIDLDCSQTYYYYYLPDSIPSRRLINNIKIVDYLYFESIEHMQEFKTKLLGSFKDHKLSNIILSTYSIITELNERLFIEKNKLLL